MGVGMVVVVVVVMVFPVTVPMVVMPASTKRHPEQSGADDEDDDTGDDREIGIEPSGVEIRGGGGDDHTEHRHTQRMGDGGRGRQKQCLAGSSPRPDQVGGDDRLPVPGRQGVADSEGDGCSQGGQCCSRPEPVESDHRSESLDDSV